MKKNYKEVFWNELNKTDFYFARQHHKENINKALDKTIEFLIDGLVR